jgi:hypothetical protein
MRRNVMSLVALLAVVVGVSCGGGGDSGDKEAFCSTVLKLNDLNSELVDAQDSMSLSDMSDGLDKADELFKSLEETAPSRLVDDMKDLNRIDSDSVRISEQERYREAQSNVNEYIHQDCDLDIDL